MAISRVASKRDEMGTLKRRHKAGMASDRSLIERLGSADTLVTLLTFIAEF